MRSSVLSRGGILLSLVVILALVLMTSRRNQVWRSEITLWEDTALKSPWKPRPRANLAAAYAEAGRLDDAIREFDNAILLAEFRPTHEQQYGVPRAFSSIGSVLVRQHRTAEAETMLSEAWTKYPGHPGIGVNLASAFLAEARRRLQAAIGVTSESILAWEAGWTFEAPGYLYWNRANAFYMLGNCLRANQDFKTAQRLEADLAKLPVPVCSAIN